MSQKYWSDEVGEAAVFGMFHVELTSEVRDLGDYCTRKIKLSPIDKVYRRSPLDVQSPCSVTGYGCMYTWSRASLIRTPLGTDIHVHVHCTCTCPDIRGCNVGNQGVWDCKVSLVWGCTE